MTIINGEDGLKSVELRYESLRKLQDELGPYLAGEGFFLKEETALSPSDVLRFKIMLPGDFVLVEGVGVVIWVRTPEECGANDPPGTAVGFATLSEQGRELIERMVQTHHEQGGRPFDLTRPSSAPVSGEARSTYHFSVRDEPAPSIPPESSQDQERPAESAGDLPFPEEKAEAPVIQKMDGEQLPPGKEEHIPYEPEAHGQLLPEMEKAEETPSREPNVSTESPALPVAETEEALSNEEEKISWSQIREDFSTSAEKQSEMSEFSSLESTEDTPSLRESVEPGNVGLLQDREELQSKEAPKPALDPELTAETAPTGETDPNAVVVLPGDELGEETPTFRVPTSPNLDVVLADEGSLEVSTGRKDPSKRLWKVLVWIFVLGAVGGAGWWFWPQYGPGLMKNFENAEVALKPERIETQATAAPENTAGDSVKSGEDSTAAVAENETPAEGASSGNSRLSSTTELPGETPAEPTQAVTAPKEEPVRTPETAASTAPASEVLDLAWKAGTEGTTVRIRSNGRVEETRLRGGGLNHPPRYLLRIDGITSPFHPLEISLDSPEVERIRFGYHADTSPPSLWVVFDLKDPSVKMLSRRVEGNGIEILLGR